MGQENDPGLEQEPRFTTFRFHTENSAAWGTKLGYGMVRSRSQQKDLMCKRDRKTSSPKQISKEMGQLVRARNERARRGKLEVEEEG